MLRILTLPVVNLQSFPHTMLSTVTQRWPRWGVRTRCTKKTCPYAMWGIGWICLNVTEDESELMQDIVFAFNFQTLPIRVWGPQDIIRSKASFLESNVEFALVALIKASEEAMPNSAAFFKLVVIIVLFNWLCWMKMLSISYLKQCLHGVFAFVAYFFLSFLI